MRATRRRRRSRLPADRPVDARAAAASARGRKKTRRDRRHRERARRGFWPRLKYHDGYGWEFTFPNWRGAAAFFAMLYALLALAGLFTP